MQKKPELICGKPMATEAIGFHIEFQFLYHLVFYLTSHCVEIVIVLGFARQTCNHETLVLSFDANFRLHYYPPLFVP